MLNKIIGKYASLVGVSPTWKLITLPFNITSGSKINNLSQKQRSCCGKGRFCSASSFDFDFGVYS